jgi:hypothetical protein
MPRAVKGHWDDVYVTLQPKQIGGPELTNPLLEPAAPPSPSEHQDMGRY